MSRPWPGLEGIRHHLIGYVLSFAFIGIYWNNHHHLLQAAHQVNGRILWANLHLLFWLSLVPFTPTGWATASSPRSRWRLYGVVFLAAGVAYSLLTRALIGHHGKSSALADGGGGGFQGEAVAGAVRGGDPDRAQGPAGGTGDLCDGGAGAGSFRTGGSSGRWTAVNPPESGAPAGSREHRDPRVPAYMLFFPKLKENPAMTGTILESLLPRRRPSTQNRHRRIEGEDKARARRCSPNLVEVSLAPVAGLNLWDWNPAPART